MLRYVQGADDAKNRSLPQSLFAKLLGNKLGTTVDPTKVKGMLAKGFGDDASNKMLKAAGMLKGQARPPSVSQRLRTKM